MIPSWLGKAIVKADCIRFKPNEGYVSPTYVMYALNSRPVQQRTTAIIHGIGRPRLNLSEIKNIAVPLPPTAEQTEIAEGIEQSLSIVDKLMATVEANLKHAGRLRQAILKQAFEGKLVPQDPSDEPASELLKRIQRERQQTLSKKPKTRTNKRATAKVDPAGHVGTLF
jgi:type I restriction enzyme, S subunit